MTVEERLIAVAFETDPREARRLLGDRIVRREQRTVTGTTDNERN